MNKRASTELVVFASFALIALIGLLMATGGLGSTGAAVRATKTTTTTVTSPFQITPPVITDAAGTPISSVDVGWTVKIGTAITNPQTTIQPFTYIVTIRDSAGVSTSLSWVSGTLNPGETKNPAIFWTPSFASDYQINVQVPAELPKVTYPPVDPKVIWDVPFVVTFPTKTTTDTTTITR